MIKSIALRPITILVFFAILITSHSLVAQKMDRIQHLKGTRTINGIQVTVTREGYVDSLSYCGEDTGPYFAGNDYSKSCCQTGSYIFTFSQPVKKVYLNIAALSTSDSYDEEAVVYVNGVHYKVTNVGENSNCEPIVIISDEGNIRPCLGCSGSGADKIPIEGSITTLKVTCNIIKGEPQGMVFGVYMGEILKDPIENTLINYTATIEESVAGKEIILESPQLNDALVTLKNMHGYHIPLHYRTIEANRIVIDVSDLAKGEYLLEINLNDQIEKQKILIE